MPTFCQKNVHALKKQCPHVLFSKSVHDKHATVVPMFDQKTSILSKIHYILGLKSQYDAIFPDFSRKK